MAIKTRRLIIAALVSAVIVAVLLRSARFQLPDLSRANPRWLLALGGSYLIQIVLRGNLLRAFAEPALRGARWRWVRLAARHQAIFAVLPMGVGDAGFPYFANRLAGMPTLAAVRLLLQLRMRDVVIVFAMAAIGMVALRLSSQGAFLIAALAFPALYFADRLAMIALRLAAKFIPSQRLSRLLRDVADIRPATPRDRAIFAAYSVGIWGCSIFAVSSAFHTIGVPMSIAQATVFIAAVNIAGLMKVSIAGLGVAEAGATTAMVATGLPLERAASLALIVRPSVLVAMLLACLLVDGLLSLWAATRRA